MERRDGKNQHYSRPDPVQKMEMMQIIWERRKEFVTYAEIGEELGISGKTAWKYFHEYELFLVPPQVEQERLMHVQQMEEMIARAHRLLKRAPDVETELKILAELRAWMKDYRRFMGMEGAKNVKHTVQTEFDASMKELEEEFGDFEERTERMSTKEREQRKGRFT